MDTVDLARQVRDRCRLTGQFVLRSGRVADEYFALGRHTGLPCAFVRKAAKPYGTARLAEGADVAGRRVLVVEDVVTSGGQIAISTGQLRELGAHVDHALLTREDLDRVRDEGR